MTPRVWLHVGLPKCGSTTIQRHFAQRAAVYARAGLCYPTAHRATRGYQSHRPLADLGPRALPRAIARIAEEADGMTDILVSTEKYTNALHDAALSDVTDALAFRFGADAVTVLVYLRHPVDFVESAFAQFLRAGLFGIDRTAFYRGGPPTIDRFLNAFAVRRGYPAYHLRGWIEEIATAAPRSHLVVRSLDDLPGSDLVADVCGLIGIPPAPNRPRRNARLSSRTIAAFAYAQSRVDQATFANLRSALRTLPLSDAPVVNENLNLSALTRAEVVAASEAARPWLRARISTSMDGLFTPRPPAPGPSDLTEAERRRIRNLIAARGPSA